jgi:3-oxoacyl-[acyl-carrier-protein] synthase III
MNLAQLSNVRIEGLAACVPSRTVHNSNCELIPEKERALFIRSTGIAHRRVAAPGTCTSDLCTEAAQKLMTALGWTPVDVRIIVLVTQTPDLITPASAILIQERLGCPVHCAAFDINLGCSGYVYGIWTVASLLQGMPDGTKALLLAGDVSTACISPNDRSTVPLFSDAGSATAMTKDGSADGIMHFALSSNGAAKEAIWIPHGGYRDAFSAHSLQMEDLGNGIVRRPTDLVLNGIDVYQHAAQNWPGQISALLAAARLDVEDIDAGVFHQANKVINEMVRRRTGLSETQTPTSLYDLGNSGTASIPVTMAYAMRQRLTAHQSTLLLSGFGVGLSWASMVAAFAPMRSVLWCEFDD